MWRYTDTVAAAAERERPMSIVPINVAGRQERRLRRLDHVRYASDPDKAILVESRAGGPNQVVDPTMKTAMEDTKIAIEDMQAAMEDMKIAIEDTSMSGRPALTGTNRLESVTMPEETMVETGMREGAPGTMMRGEGEGPQADEMALMAKNHPKENTAGTRAGDPVGTEVVDAGTNSGKQQMPGMRLEILNAQSEWILGAANRTTDCFTSGSVPKVIHVLGIIVSWRC